MLLNVLLIIISCSSLINAFTDVKQCKPAAGNVIPQTDVQFGDCVTPPCVLPRGQNTTIEMIFVAADDYPAVITSLTATVMGMKHGYPGLDGSDGCSKLYSMPDRTKTTCPIEKGKSYLFEIVMPVKTTFPKISAPVHIAVKDKKSNREVACFDSSIKIT